MFKARRPSILEAPGESYNMRAEGYGEAMLEWVEDGTVERPRTLGKCYQATRGLIERRGRERIEGFLGGQVWRRDGCLLILRSIRREYFFNWKLRSDKNTGLECWLSKKSPSKTSGTGRKGRALTGPAREKWELRRELGGVSNEPCTDLRGRRSS